ncbi:MAG: hypothetical protein ACKVQK_04025 [Burkholderiales bacterium]
MNRLQWITLVVAAFNLMLVWLFPPFDYVSQARSGVATFDGFAWAFDERPNYVVNKSFLQLEFFVVLLNAAIAWLLFRDRAAKKLTGKKSIDWQRVVMFGVGINLLLVLLFPPMENYYAVTRAALPSFDGFYFLFGDHGARAIVPQMLYIEVIFILINGALLYLLLRKGGGAELTPAQRAALAAEVRRAQR